MTPAMTSFHICGEQSSTKFNKVHSPDPILRYCTCVQRYSYLAIPRALAESHIDVQYVYIVGLSTQTEFLDPYSNGVYDTIVEGWKRFMTF
jgi:hypothetical protein